MTAYVVFSALREEEAELEQPCRSPGGLGTSARRTLADVPRHHDDAQGGRAAARHDHQSGNDASVALAEGVAGTVDNFVQLMNRQAQTGGLKNTEFKNVTGTAEPGHKAVHAICLSLPRTSFATSWVLRLLLAARLHLQQDPPGQPQPVAAPRPDGGRPADQLRVRPATS